MHPARKAAAVFLVLTVVGVFAGLIYGATTTGMSAVTGGWVLLALSTLFLSAALISVLIWRLRR